MSYKYYPRLKMWKNRRATFTVVESTMTSHSYSWYELGKYFDVNGRKIYVVNDYCYSMQTTRHRYGLVELLKNKGIKYETMQAPRGLQDLDSVKRYYLQCIAGLMVRDKYGRYSRTQYINSWIKELDGLEKFGIKYTQRELDWAFKNKEQERRQNLDWKKEQRKKEREQYLQTIKGKKELFQKQLNQMVR